MKHITNNVGYNVFLTLFSTLFFKFLVYGVQKPGVPGLGSPSLGRDPPGMINLSQDAFVEAQLHVF